MKAFAADYHVVAIDMRGYGETERPPHIADYTVKNLSQDLAELIPALGHSAATLVAHDWGGVVAWIVTQKYPDLVEKLIVLNCPHGKIMRRRFKRWSQVMKSWYMFLFQVPLLPEYLLSVKDYGAFDDLRSTTVNKNAFTKEDSEAYKYIYSQPGAITAPVNYYRALFRGRSLVDKDGPKEQPIEVPTLLIWGDKDIAFDVDMADEHTEEIGSNITVRHIPESSHFVQSEAPEKVNQFIQEFMAQE
jgi:pimeloyl-ACP methyl ester carboxylesterase